MPPGRRAQGAPPQSPAQDVRGARVSAGLRVWLWLDVCPRGGGRRLPAAFPAEPAVSASTFFRLTSFRRGWIPPAVLSAQSSRSCVAVRCRGRTTSATLRFAGVSGRAGARALCWAPGSPCPPVRAWPPSCCGNPRRPRPVLAAFGSQCVRSSSPGLGLCQVPRGCRGLTVRSLEGDPAPSALGWPPPWGAGAPFLRAHLGSSPTTPVASGLPAPLHRQPQPLRVRPRLGVCPCEGASP